MNKYIITFLIVGLLLFSFVGVSQISNPEITNKNIVTEKNYSGPVRPTDDLEYFRKTGITIPKEINK